MHTPVNHSFNSIHVYKCDARGYTESHGRVTCILKLWQIVWTKTESAIMECKMSLVVRKPVFGVSDLVRHKPGCAVTEDG